MMNLNAKLKVQSAKLKRKTLNFKLWFFVFRFAFFAFCFLLFYSVLQAGIWEVLTLGDIPVYPALQKTSEQNLVINAVRLKTEFYKGENISIPHAIEYYKKMLTQRGWKTDGEKVLVDSSVNINFISKDMRMFSLSFLSGEKIGKPNFIFVRMSYSLEGLDKWTASALPGADNKDMPGEDISWLKRYPGSIRTKSTSDDKGYIMTNYKIAEYSCVECIADFYKQEMLSKGWELINIHRQTKEDMEKQNFNLDKLLNNYFESMKTNFNTPEKLEQIKQLMAQSSPDEIKTLSFKRGRDLCNISISYRSAKQQNQNEPENQFNLWDKQKEQVTDARIAFLLELQKQSKQRIDISVMYIPEAKLKGGQIR